MKKLLKLSFYFAMAGLMFAACSKDDPEEEELLKPQISVLTPTGGEATVTPGSTAAVSITMSSNDKLEKLSATGSLNGSAPLIMDLSSDPNETDSTFESGTRSFRFDGFVDVLGTAGSTYVVVFTVTDKDDRTSSATITFTIENDAPTVATYTVVIVGNQNSSAGSYYDAINNTVNTSAQANANQGSIDFMYFNGSSNAHTLSSPDATASASFGSVSTWTSRNSTRFSGDLGLSSTEFDGVSSSSEVQAYAASNSADLANQLSVGDVISFTTAANRGSKSGLVKIAAINAANNTMELTVKIEL